MSTEEFHRKLTAILSADVQGYSRLMGEDEESTVRTLTAYRTLMSSLIRDHRGQVVDTPGDNLLAKFDSGTDAVRCAVEIQEELRIRNADLPENRKMQFRIGINLGDVIEEGDRIYGDGINVAARIEGLAEGGGICISGFVYGAIKNKLSLSYEFIGEHNVKNIKDPVRVYRIRMEPDAAAPKVKEKAIKVRTWQRVAFPVVVIFILGAIAYILFDNFYLDKLAIQTEVESRVAELAAPAVDQEEEAPKTIAVLPFADLSPEKDQEYFVDGLSEEILNSLAQIPDLTVIARTSSFSFKGTTKKIQEIASELGVAHILEGSVRKAGNDLRITAQLVKGVDGSHLWSKIYDRELKDIFDVQEDIANSVADELKVTLGIGKSIKQLGGTDNVEAYQSYLIAKGLWMQEGHTAAGRALEVINAAIAMDPEFALAWATKANVQNLMFMVGPEEYADVLDASLQAAQKAIELEPNLPETYAALGGVRMMRGEKIEAEVAFRKALELRTEPISGNPYFTLLLEVGHLKKARENLEAQLLIDPLSPTTWNFYIVSSFLMGDTQRAEEEIKRAKELFGNQWDIGFGYSKTLVHLGAGEVMSRDEITCSDDPICDEAKVNFESPEEALAELHRLYNDGNVDFMSIAIWTAYFGDPEFAMDAIEKASGRPGTLWCPVMRDLRQTPRFKEYVKEIGLVDYWEKFGYPDLCHPTDDSDFECD